MKRSISLLLSLISVCFLSAQDPVTRPLTESSLKELPVLFQQTAAEYRALCYQAFNIARLRLDAIPKKKFRKEHLAIITDLDETILNNSYSEAQNIKEGKGYSNKSWKEWTAKKMATGVPGAVEFLQYANSRGVSIFYISNRDTADVNNTLAVLKNLGVPDADMAHCLFLSDTSSKEKRRQIVMGQYNVVMLMGDNLGDFTAAFDKRSIGQRLDETDKVKAEWGKKFIVLPNPAYGEWEGALYDYNYGLTPEQKEAARQKLLKGYKLPGD